MVIILIKVFLRLADSFNIIFRQETSSALQGKSQKRISSACLFTFNQRTIFALSWGSNILPFHCKSTKRAGNFVVCLLKVGMEAIQ